MKKQSTLLFSVIALFSSSLLIGCNNKSSFSVTWKNYDGTILEKDVDVKKGSVPTYDSKTPFRLDDASNYYVFSGWNPEVKEIKKNMVYTAKYDSFPLTNVEETPDGYIDVTPTNTDDGNIFHAFCWKFKDIEEKLEDIKNAGFKSVQISPVQEPKSGGSEWWAFYQPLSFSIANHSALGTKAELTSMCTKAETLGISIIADIVFNHMANISDDDKESDGTPKVFPGVEEYEPYIYQHRNDANDPTFHHNPNATGSGAITQTYPYGGLPDLNTENEYVQERSLDLLKECIDVGIDGFRFDAAKHIETPDDPEYASNFWPHVLNPAKEYYHTLTNKDLFLYGEILGNVDGGRSIDIYTKLMKVLEDSYGTALRSNINGYAKAALANYGKKTEPNNLITLMETHDTFEHEKSHIDDLKTMRGYAIAATRQSTKGLFFARTDDAATVGKIGSYEYESNILGAINRFRNRFDDGEEYRYAEDSLYVNQRVNGDSKGAIIVDLNNNGKVVVKLDKLATGVYYDQITGQSYTVRNGHLILDIPASGIVILTMSKNEERPYIDIDFRDDVFVGSKEVTVKTNGNGSYRINGGTSINFTSKEQKITLGDVVDANNKIELEITIQKGPFTIKRIYHYQKAQLIPGKFNILNVNPSYFTNNELYLWSWDNVNPGHWSKDFTVQDGIVLVDAAGLAGFILAVFPKDYVISDVNNWDFNVLRQTADIKGSILAQGYYDASDL